VNNNPEYVNPVQYPPPPKLQEIKEE